MHELKVAAQLHMEASRTLRSRLSELRVQARAGVHLKAMRADVQCVEYIREHFPKLAHLDDAKLLRIGKGMIRSEISRKRLYREKVHMTRNGREVHVARMFLKGTPLNMVEDPEFTHPRSHDFFDRVWMRVAPCSKDAVKPEGFNGTTLMWFTLWVEAGGMPNGVPRQPPREKKPYTGPKDGE